MILKRRDGIWRNLWFEAWIWIALENVDISLNGYIQCLQMAHLRYKLENCYYNATIITNVYYYYYYYYVVYKISNIVIAYYVV